MPKAPSFSDDEDEKTTIESGGWEEEASTTVEQGEVADKIRALGVGLEARRANTSITSTNGGGMSDEPTVDDQRGAAALAMLPPQNIARLVITQGNDSGKAIEVRPGKTYTIGRGIDNDFVLTDIAVSRKHFDLRSENGAWVLADRGSGNGTLVNSRLEDAPFMLASGDVIEIGNTSFRFDLSGSSGAAAGSAREFPSTQPGYEGSADDDLEMSTMSGKLLNETEAATPAQIVAPVAPVVRPKTLPPPAPLPRPRTQSGRPIAGYALDRPGPQSQSHALPPMPMAQPALAAALAPTLSPMGVHGLPIQLQPQPQTTLPLPQMANRPPLGHAALVDLPLGSALGSALGSTLGPALGSALGSPHGAQPTTIPGQGPPIQPPRSARLPFSYPSAQDISQQPPTPNGASRQMAVVSGQPGRDATSTALVQPISYANGHPVMVPQPAYGPPPQLTRRMKMALAAAGLALFAAVATIAIIKGASSGAAPRGNGAQAPDARPAEPRPIVEPIRDPKIIKSIELPRSPKDKTVQPAAPTPTAPRTEKLTPAPSQSASTVPAPSTPAPSTPAPSTSSALGPTAPTPTAPTPTAPAPTASTPTAPTPTAPALNPRTDKIATTAPGAPQGASPTATPPLTPTPGVPTAGPATPSPAAAAGTAVPARSAPTPGTPLAADTDPVQAETTTTPTPGARTDKTNRTDIAAQTPTRGERKTPKRPDKKPDPKKPAASKSDAAHAETDKTDKTEIAAPPRTERKRGGRTTQDVKNEANALYRAKNFSGAAALVTSSLSAFSSDDAQDLKAIAAVYSQLGKAYSVGMAPGTKPTDAFGALRRAINFDRDAGSAYLGELQDRLTSIAPRAAASYMAAKEYESAFQAVRQSESLGSKSQSNQTVRSLLEAFAADLLRAAQSEMASDPEGAKRKLRQILGMVDTKNPLYGRAQKLLNGP